jgi:ribonuclease BN (tRNA processing enzyme)
MECVLLGSGGMMPMPSRFLTSLAVRLQGQFWLSAICTVTTVSVSPAC